MCMYMYIYIYINKAIANLAKLSTWCFEHSGDIGCSLLVDPSHIDESWEEQNTCLWIYIYIYIYIYKFNQLDNKHANFRKLKKRKNKKWQKLLITMIVLKLVQIRVETILIT